MALGPCTGSGPRRSRQPLSGCRRESFMIDIENRRAYARKYKVENRERIKAWAKSYRIRNKDKLRAKYQKNKAKLWKHYKAYRENNLKSWLKIIPEVTHCQICGMEIYFNKKVKATAIHFDHKQEHSVIEDHPIDFLRRSPCTAEKEKIWREASLGMLCKSCNSYLPTKGRRAYIKKVVRYVFGEEYAKHL